MEVRGSSIVVVAGKRRDFEGDGEREMREMVGEGLREWRDKAAREIKGGR